MRYCAWLLCVLTPHSWAAPYPDRPGKKVVEKICGGCHGLKLMEPMRRTRAQWQTSVDDMLTRGMKADESEMEEAVNYLAKYLSRLNVNKASAADLTDVLDLPAPQAAALVEYRGRNGPLKNFDELENIPGLDKKILAAQRDRIAFRDAAF